jgi:hypothetical protein
MLRDRDPALCLVISVNVSISATCWSFNNVGYLDVNDAKAPIGIICLYTVNPDRLCYFL